ncbi:MAG: protocatechuate 3,4-dioxygenase [Immundisolibacter sp.]|uniref:DODA-type extradiol aromatic ring-opening family dioxygenase n=1 Tax=Immundisolibacter sp. TaxID=1934948 RepID=UPI003D138013
MAHIVGGFCVPHDPAITAFPEVANKRQAANIMAGFERVAKRVGELEADTAIVVGDDHFALFGPHCLPQFLIGIGDVEGPEENWMRFDRYPVPNNVPLAEHIMNYGFDHGFDWSVAKSLVLDHGTMIPVHLAVTPNPGVRTIPIYTASAVTPLLRLKRALALGRMIGDAVAAFPGNDRVVVMGCGGISHRVGTSDMGQVNQGFDQMILDMVVRGDVEAMTELDDAYVLREGGNGAFEIRNWIVAMGAMPRFRGEVICYEPIPEWITGLGLAELKLAA